MTDRVTIQIERGVADVRLNRPEKLNALDLPMFAALIEAGEAVAADPTVRAVVLSGEGRGFCSGLDFSAFQAMSGERRGEGGGGVGENLFAKRFGVANAGQQAVYVWSSMAAPVIAAIHGPALGGGAQLALGCDLRIVSPDAQLSILEIRWGLAPDMTGTQTLPRLVGLDVAKELTFTGRMVSGEEALRIGLATRLSERPRDDALALAQEIAAKNPHAIRGAKALLDQSCRVSLSEGLAAEERTIKALIGSPNQREAVKAFFDKRDPVFED
ncbi:MAG: crotonase/enoyl-CoA hydratase family protein [Acidimicrobiales bacterium]